MIPKNEFKPALELALSTTSKDLERPELRGVLFEFEAGLVRLVATDGHRISTVEMADGDVTPHAPFILYRAYAEKLLKTLLGDKKPEGALSIVPADLNIIFSDDSGGVEFFTMAADGERPEYPNYRRSLTSPDVPVEHAQLNAEFMRVALKHLKPFENDRHGIEITPHDYGPTYLRPTLSEKLQSVQAVTVGIMGFKR